MTGTYSCYCVKKHVYIQTHMKLRVTEKRGEREKQEGCKNRREERASEIKIWHCRAVPTTHRCQPLLPGRRSRLTPLQSISICEAHICKCLYEIQRVKIR